MSNPLKKALVVLLNPLATVIKRLGGLRRLWAYSCLNNALGGKVDASVVVLGLPEVHGTLNISLGKNLFLYRELYLETQEQGRIVIGDDVVLSRGVHIVAYSDIILEEGVMIGEYSSLRDANHRVQPGSSVRYSGHSAQPIHIGRNVWIGRGVTVLGGVTIGAGAVIGANAVVTKDVPAGAVAVGIPARVIKP
ncbi:MAG: acyltransferase [Methylococcaceae bacterium]|nr:acyltransferase [Methylococcaceae bacterium]